MPLFLRRPGLAGLSLFFLFLCLPSSSYAQKRNGLAPQYSKWLNEEVNYIITDEEKKGFLRLTTDADRDRFMEDFWTIRNPVPGAVPNTYKEEHYKRLAYVNDNFGRKSGTPGWRTDMGRSYILFGKPKTRAQFISYSQLYPCELWFYSNETGNPSIPSYFSLLFFMPEDAGEFRFYRPFLDGPMTLVRGTQFNSNADVYNFLRPIGPDLALASISLVPGEVFDLQTYTPGMGSDMLLARIQNFANDYFNVNQIRERRSLQEHVTAYFMSADQRPLDVNVLSLADPNGQYWVDYSVSIDRPELGKPAPDNKSLSVALSYRLLTEAGKLVVEDSSERLWPAFEPTDGKKTFLPFQIAGRLPVAPGKYTLEITIAQRDEAKSFHGQQSVVVGGRAPITISGPLLVTKISHPQRADATTPFQYFGTQFEPAARHVLESRLPLRVLYQLESADTPEDLDIEYTIAHTLNRDARKTITENVHAAQFRDKRLITSKALPLTGLPDGEYRVVMTVKKAGSAESLASVNVAMRLDTTAADAALYFDPNTRKMNQPGVGAYIRALCALSQGEADLATSYLRQSVDQNPANETAAWQLIRAYFDSKRYADVAAMYAKLGEKPFEGSVESLAQLSLSLWNAGQHEGARSVLADARQAYGEDPLVTAVAKTVRLCGLLESRLKGGCGHDWPPHNYGEANLYCGVGCPANCLSRLCAGAGLL